MSFIHTTRPLHTVAKIFGLLPFSVGISSKKRLMYPYIRVIDLVWFLTVLATNLITIILICNSFRLAESEKNNLLYMYTCTRMILIYDLTFVVVCGCFDLINRYVIVQIMNEFSQIDKEVSNFETDRRSIYMCIIHLFILYILNIFQSSLTSMCQSIIIIKIDFIQSKVC